MRIKLFCFCLILLFAIPAISQETVSTTFISSAFSGAPGNPLVITNEKGRHWVVVWKQDNVLYSRIVRRDGTALSAKVILSGLTSTNTAFDLLHSRKTRNYLLVFESAGALRVQSYNQRFTRMGPPVLIQKAVFQSQPKLFYDNNQNRIFLFWMASDARTTAKSMHVVELGSSGRPIGSIRTLMRLPAGYTFDSYHVAQNAGGSHLLVANETTSTSSRITAYNLDSNLELKSEAPVILQQVPVSGSAQPSAAFANPDGNALAVWNIGSQIRYRFLTNAGAIDGPPGTVAAADSNTASAVYFDSKKEEFAAVWTKDREVYAAVVDAPASADKPARIAVSEGAALNPAVSYDSASARVLIIWEEQSGAVFRIRSAVVLIRGEEFPVQGRVVLRKDYNPPFVVNQWKYLAKLHIRSRGKLFRAYVTPETEVVGNLPQEGNWVRMIYEPFRSRYRGYVEEIRIIPTP